MNPARQFDHSDFPHLFAPMTLGPLRLPNRFAMAPMTTNFAHPDGSVSAALCDYLAARARGGFALIITENIGVHGSGRVMPRMVMADSDAMLPGLTRLAQAIRAEGALVIGQLSHAGRQTRSAVTGQALVAPSPLPCPINREMPQELSLPAIAALEQDFIAAAVRLERAGFHGVELHGAHGYLLGAFLSPYSNIRTDAYGGSLENRMRFLLNVIAGIRRATSSGFALTVRISAREFVQDGIDVPEAIAIAQRLERAGIDALSISVGVYESFNQLSMITGDPEGQWLDLAGEIKRALTIPVFGVGRVKRAAVAEQAIAAGLVDIPLFGRAAIADAALPRKIASGQPERIISCVSCNICLGRSARPETICPLNPVVGRDAVLEQPCHTKTPRRIAIVGSSWPALTAAWSAALRGHAVTLYEPAETLGGMQAWRARVPGQEEFAQATASLVKRAEDAGVRIERRLPAPGAYELLWKVRNFQPRSGEPRSGEPRSGEPAPDNRAVFSSYDILARPARTLPELPAAATVLGQDLAAAEAALLLAQGGAKVSLWSPGRDIASDAHPGYRASQRQRLTRFGAVIHTRALPDDGARQPGAEQAMLVLGQAGTLPTLDALTAPDTQWHEPYPGNAPDAWLADAYEPNFLTAAIYQAFSLGHELDTNSRAESARGR